MAKRVISWIIDGKVLKMAKYNKEAITPEVLGTYDINELFPNELTPVQSYIIVYGLKQKLADVGAAEKIAEDKVKAADEVWNNFKEGKVAMPRANGTGATEARKVAKKVSEVMSTVSLEGLTLKKMMFPDTFTKEDQEKLNEFIQLQSEHLVKQAKTAEEKAEGLETEIKLARVQAKDALEEIKKLKKTEAKPKVKVIKKSKKTKK